jgi:hypothetical protein
MNADRRLPRAIKIGEVHHYAPWGRTTTFKLVKTGVLPARRLDGSISYVLAEDLEQLLVSGTASASSN